MKPALATILFALTGVGCAPEGPAMQTVEQVLADCKAVLGRPVSVAGYLDGCGGYDCMLHASKVASAQYNGVVTALIAGQIKQQNAEVDRALESAIGLGYTEEFDRKAAKFQRSYVVIDGRMSKDSCTGIGGVDRVGGISPANIRVWTKSEGAPADAD